ncbi:hypothetical protein BUY42_11790 [Staphylococcus devriesei]|uniref:hypothetical protein n=1 Tax=Staphylococcus devriesei TaxID=586733 RepID=UPI000D1C3598|nr:hypothetical protein [Staphylococcus devriesei]PTF16939.1 hypothetical protein BUY42_11790 [Staphylococcus devriesei]
MRKFLIFSNIFILIFAFFNNNKVKDKYRISLNDIESDADILDQHGMYRDKDGNIYPKEELYE